MVHAAARGAGRVLRQGRRTTTGEVKLRLYKGNIEPVSRKSPYSLYSLDIASFTMGASYDQKDALGFINLIGLPIKVRAALAAKRPVEPVRTTRMKLWGGRFESGPSEVFERFSGSLHFDRRLIDADIRGSQAFARALERVGILTADERARIVEAFDQIRDEAAEPEFFDGAADEDVHTLVIRKLKERAGAVADKIHTGRSRNEQVSLDMRLWLREECDRVRGLLRDADAALLDLAARYPDAVIPGYTHMRRAQAVLWPHYLLAYFEMFARDCGALRRSAPPRQRDAARLRRAGRQRLSVRPRSHRARSGLRRDHAQQHGRFGRPRFRARFSLRRLRHHAAPEPPGRGLDSLFERRVRLDGTGRRRHQRIEPDAAEEESRFARADSRQKRARDRLPDVADGHDEGPADDLQSRHAGGQGAAVRGRRSS